MPLQDWVHHWGVGGGARFLRMAAALLGFIAVAGLYDMLAYQSLSSDEAMEMAQLAHNISKGNGFTTKSIRPLSIHLLNGKIPHKAAPDITNPPVYPTLLAGLMKAAPMNFAARQFWSYQPERWIAVFNQALFFVAILLLFRLAASLFDDRVGWLSALLFGGTSLFWKFTVSGLSTILVIVIFLAMVLCLLKIADGKATESAQVCWCALAGLLVGIGGLSRYSFAWMILPVLLFLLIGVRGSRGKLCAVAAISFLVIFAPWVARNVVLTATPFGTAGYAVLEGTPPLDGDSLERSLNPTPAIRQVEIMDIVDKLLANGGVILRNDLPKFGGNWIIALFLAGLLIPFQSPARGRIRWLLIGSIVLMAVVQALGQTHLSQDLPEINSENLLVILAPLAFIYGAALFYTLLDQSNIPIEAQGAVVGFFLTIMCAPLLLIVVTGVAPVPTTPYSPLHIQKVAQLMGEDELVMSDIPSAVAWYGDHDCSWLASDDDREFFNINQLRPVEALFLTQRTSDGHLLSQMSQDPKSWGHLYLECEAHLEVQGHGEVPSGFPLTNAPSGFLPDQLLLSDHARWEKNRPGEK